MTRTKKTYPVSIINFSPAWNYCAADCLQIKCTPMTKSGINRLFQKASIYHHIPETSCIYSISMAFNENVTKSFSVGTSNGIKEKNVADLKIRLQMRNSHKCSHENCFHNIRCGKCTDKFMIDLIGKILFKDKYQKQK